MSFNECLSTLGGNNYISQDFCCVSASGDSKASGIKSEENTIVKIAFAWGTRTVAAYRNLMRAIGRDNSVCFVSLR